MSGSGASPLMLKFGTSVLVDERPEGVALVGDGARAQPVADADLHPGDRTGSTREAASNSPRTGSPIAVAGAPFWPPVREVGRDVMVRRGAGSRASRAARAVRQPRSGEPPARRGDL